MWIMSWVNSTFNIYILSWELNCLQVKLYHYYIVDILFDAKNIYLFETELFEIECNL